MIDTLGAGDTFNAAVLYYLNKSKVEFVQKCKKEIACTNDYNQAKDESFDEELAFREDMEQNSKIKSAKYNRPDDFIDKVILQRAIKFVCCIAGAKVAWLRLSRQTFYWYFTTGFSTLTKKEFILV